MTVLVRRGSAALAAALPILLAGCNGGPSSAAQVCAASGPALIDERCTSCHSASVAGGAPQGLDFTSTAVVRQNSARIRQAAVDGSAMPPGDPLAACNRQVLSEFLASLGGECTPNCTSRTCGGDGCGGSCGTCAAGEQCGSAGRCAPVGCTPSCGSAACGDDGCGGSCGDCAAGSTCSAGRCVAGAHGFAADVFPVFQAHGCARCHGSRSPDAGLDLSSSRSAFDGMIEVPSTQCSSRKLVAPGNAAASYLVNKLTGIGMCAGGRMPRGGGALTGAEVDSVRAWIEAGAVF